MQLAQTLGVAQSTLNAYELGQRRVPVSALPILAKSLEELIGVKPALGRRGPTPKLQCVTRSPSRRYPSSRITPVTIPNT